MMDAWRRDIESAPRDEMVLALDASGVDCEVGVVWWDDEAEAWLDSANRRWEPTHWQRVFLPAEVA